MEFDSSKKPTGRGGRNLEKLRSSRVEVKRKIRIKWETISPDYCVLFL